MSAPKLTEAQRAALDMIANGGARYGSLAPYSWYAAGGGIHHLTINALVKRGFIEQDSRQPYVMVITTAGRYALAAASPCDACGQPPSIARNPSGTMCFHNRPDGVRCAGRAALEASK